MNPRRIIHWDRVRDFRSTTAVVIGTGLGAGLSPVGPGTLGTLVGLPLAYWSCGWSLPERLLLWIALTAIGTWACKTYDEIMESHDNQMLVIDEVVGIGITSLSINPDGSWKAWLAAFVLFRVFDILKPPPVRQVDQWSKRGSAWLGGFGVMADDLVAAVESLALLFFFQSQCWV